MFVAILVIVAFNLATEAYCDCINEICQYEPWNTWSSCTKSCGGGVRKRSREICCKAALDFKECLKDCGIPYRNQFRDTETCGTTCYGGGWYSVYSSRCRCRDGYYGDCCENRVNCGNPGYISHGMKYGSTYYYDSVVTYSCNSGYKRSRGSSSLRCQLSGTWSGAKPTCTFFNTCRSNPCQNSGTCVNDFNRYSCLCRSGFSGINCERDIQAPVVDRCPADMYINTTERTKHVSWRVPSFHDPLGHSLRVSTNYPSGGYDFGWGNYIVQYYALKPSNGLSTECTFKITVRPNACKPLRIPKGGALVCNGWKQDYGQFCLQFCGNNLTLPRQYDLRQWYVCGASGAWIPSDTVPSCSDARPAATRHAPSETHHYMSCAIDEYTMRAAYIDMLRSSRYRFFCDTYKSLCSPENVRVMCD